MKLKHHIISAFFLMFLGCSPAIKVVNIYQDPAFTADQINNNNNFMLFIENISVLEYDKLFKKEYSDTSNFINVISRQIADSLGTKIGCSVLIANSPKDLPVFSPLGDQLPAPDQDYILYIKDITISKDARLLPTSPTDASKPNPFPRTDPITAPQTYSMSNMCVVTITAELWDTKTKKKVLGYSSIGESEVTPNILVYTAPLKWAIGSSIQSAVLFLKPAKERSEKVRIVPKD